MNNNFEIFYDQSNSKNYILECHKLISNDNIVPIITNIPRFVSSDNYAIDFGFQWNEFSNTQLDSYTKTKISENRLQKLMQGHLNKVKNKLILEAGSGAGRFTEILLKYNAKVHSFDYSNAVEANAKNNGSSNNLTLAQASIDSIPFEKETYDYVICIGVLQHTPNPEICIKNLWKMVKPGGHMIIDHYAFKWSYILPPPIGGSESIYRFFIQLLPHKYKYLIVKKIVDFFFQFHWFFRNKLFIQRLLRRISPLHFYYPEFSLSSKELYYQWSLLDTHDGLTDKYKHYRSKKQIENFFKLFNYDYLAVSKGGNGIEVFCTKKN